jgi:RNA polymerase sigma factor (sigma-70 family)
MDPVTIESRLSQISTAWSLIDRAHGVTEPGAVALLVQRYQTAVYRYLLAAAKDSDAADELFQEFALRLVRGDFGRADPHKGRFRDYVKSALINLVIDHQNRLRRRRETGPLAAEPTAPEPDRTDSDQQFLGDWRQALLDRTWEGLAAAQKPGGPPFFAALKARSDQPDWSVAQLAEHLTARLKPSQPFTEAGVRKILQRAREGFTDLLVAEVARSLHDPSEEHLEQEVIELGFQAHCRRALDRRKGRRGDAPKREA